MGREKKKNGDFSRRKIQATLSFHRSLILTIFFASRLYSSGQDSLPARLSSTTSPQHCTVTLGCWYRQHSQVFLTNPSEWVSTEFFWCSGMYQLSNKFHSSAVQKDVRNSPLELIKDPEEDQFRMSAYPHLEYQNLYNAICMLVSSKTTSLYRFDITFYHPWNMFNIFLRSMSLTIYNMEYKVSIDLLSKMSQFSWNLLYSFSRFQCTAKPCSKSWAAFSHFSIAISSTIWHICVHPSSRCCQLLSIKRS